MIRILLVESEKEQIHILEEAFRCKGYLFLQVNSANEALAAMDETSVQMIVADSNCGGLDLTMDLRCAGITLPVIIITANTARAEMRRIFRSGADGYMVFPIDAEELLMRIENLLWRCNILAEASLRLGSCVLHAQSFTLETRDGEIELRRMEFLLLEKLMSFPGKIFSRPQLMDELWGYDSESDPRTVDTHIRRLRQKLSGVDDIRIQTVRGIGYRAVVPRKIRKSEKQLKKGI